MLENQDDFKVLYTKDLMDILGIGRDKAYALMKSRSFPSTRIGRTYFVTAENLKTWMKNIAGKTITVWGGEIWNDERMVKEP